MKKNYFLISISLGLAMISRISAQFSDQTIINEDVFGVTEIITTDIDNDNDKDIITSQRYFNNHKISYFLNFGDGNFSKQYIVSTNVNTPNAVATGDFDTDGWIDIVAISKMTNTVLLFPNQSGTFPEETLLDDTLFQPVDVKVDDVDNDGDMDIVVMDRVEIQVYFNTGSWQFFKETIAPGIISEYFDLYMADVTGDGYKDIFAGGSSKTIIYRNINGYFVMDEARTASIEMVGVNHLVYAVDLDGDNDFDLVTDGNFNTDLRWYANNGNGFFEYASTVQVVDHSKSVTAGDFDGDGDQDLFSTNPQTGEVGWYENIGNGNFSAMNVVHIAPSAAAVEVFSDDINNDGKYDLLWSSELSYHLNNFTLSTEEHLNNKFKIYPNPATKKTINIQTESPGILKIYNSIGQLIHDTIKIYPGTHAYSFELKPSAYY